MSENINSDHIEWLKTNQHKTQFLIPLFFLSTVPEYEVVKIHSVRHSKRSSPDDVIHRVRLDTHGKRLQVKILVFVVGVVLKWRFAIFDNFDMPLPHPPSSRFLLLWPWYYRHKIIDLLRLWRHLWVTPQKFMFLLRQIATCFFNTNVLHALTFSK